MFIVLWLYTGISILQRPSLVGTCGTASWVWESNLRWVDCPVWKIPGVHSLVGFYINIFLLCDTPQSPLSPMVHLICFVDLPICCLISPFFFWKSASRSPLICDWSPDRRLNFLILFWMVLFVGWYARVIRSHHWFFNYYRYYDYYDYYYYYYSIF